MTINLEFMFEVRAQIGRPQAIGKSPNGVRTIMPVLGGTVRGPALNGKILPEAGADWALIRPDGSIVLDVRSVIKADNGDLIYTSYGGRMWADTLKPMDGLTISWLLGPVRAERAVLCIKFAG